MRWTERQRAMLQAFGVRLFEPPAAAAAPSPAPAQAKAAAVAVLTEPVTVPARPAPPGSPALPAQPLQRDDVAALGWDELRAAVAACQACALSRSRRQTVFGVGHPHAHWMIVGEAPGEHEDRQGEPFVGAAGQLLDNMLRAIGLTRDEAPPERQVFITNTLKCRPPKNRNPEPSETAQCSPFLERQIALVQPRIILAMGRFAAQALLGGDEPLGKLRGRVHQVRGVPVVVTYHPAYLLRTLADKARSWEDLCLAATLVQGN